MSSHVLETWPIQGLMINILFQTHQLHPFKIIVQHVRFVNGRGTCGSGERNVKIWIDFRKSPRFSLTSPFSQLREKSSRLVFYYVWWALVSVWVRFQEHGSSFYVNIEEKVWLLVKKILTWKDWLKLHFLTEIGRFHWNQGEKVAHFAWFGDPCSKPTNLYYYSYNGACLVEK
jgi:hypothetical protein